MKSLVGEVGEPRLSGPDVLGDFDSLGDGEMGGVGFLAKSIDDEDGNMAELMADRGGDGGAIGQVGGPWLTADIDTESGGGDAAVRDGEGGKSNCAERERAGDGVRLGANVGGASFEKIEGVVESFFEAGKSEGIGVDGNTVTISDGVGAEVVEASDMIGVAMGVEDGIDFGDGGAQGLGPEIR